MSLLNPVYEEIGKTFVAQYYAMFDDPAQRPNLVNLYNADLSFMTFEGQQIQGAPKILEKLQLLTFQKITRVITAVDSQPMFDGGVLINVLGRLQCDDDPPHAFNQRSKQFISQKRVNASSEEAMQAVYQRTIQLLYKGSSIASKPTPPTVDDPKPTSKCKSCSRPSNTVGTCSNCPISTCGSCGLKCSGCSQSLCFNCVYIFGCLSSNSTPMCDRCRLNQN